MVDESLQVAEWAECPGAAGRIRISEPWIYVLPAGSRLTGILTPHLPHSFSNASGNTTPTMPRTTLLDLANRDRLWSLYCSSNVAQTLSLPHRSVVKGAGTRT
jgi:hypothetical protein